MFIFLFPGGGRDLDSEPGAVLQTILRVHVQHLIVNIIFQSSQLVSPCHRSVRCHAHAHTHAHVSLLPHLSVGQSPIVKTKPPLLSIKPVTLSRLHLWTPLTEFGSWYSPCGVFLKKTNKQINKQQKKNLLSFSHLVAPHASTETVSLMPWMSVSASAVTSSLVESL